MRKKIPVAHTPLLFVPYNPQLGFIWTPSPGPHPSCLTLRITTAPDQAQWALLAKFLSKSPAPSLTWGNPSTNWAGLSKDCLLENDVRPGQSGGQWLAGAEREAEAGLKQRQGRSSHFLTCAFNQTKTSHSVIIAEGEPDVTVGACCLPPSPQQL